MKDRIYFVFGFLVLICWVPTSKEQQQQEQLVEDPPRIVLAPVPCRGDRCPGGEVTEPPREGEGEDVVNPQPGPAAAPTPAPAAATAAPAATTAAQAVTTIAATPAAAPATTTPKSK